MVIPHCTDPSDDLGYDNTDLVAVVTVPVICFLVLIIVIAATSITAAVYCKCKRSNDVVSSK